MVRPLMEIEKPWLTREQVQAAIWRLTGTRNTAAVDQLLNVMDIYAASQGPALAEKIRERDRIRGRWSTGFPSYSFSRPVSQPAIQIADELPDSRSPVTDSGKSHEVQEKDDEELTGDSTLRDFEFSEATAVRNKPAKAAPVWELPDGRMFQQCSACIIPKDYLDFHRDSSRWNGRSSQCKTCKNGSKQRMYRNRVSQAIPASSSVLDAR